MTATVGHGHFIAWWPGSHGVTGLGITTTSGTSDQPVDPAFARSHPQPDNQTIVRSPSRQIRTTG